MLFLGRFIGLFWGNNTILTGHHSRFGTATVACFCTFCTDIGCQFVTKSDEFSTKNDEFSTKNDEFSTKNDGFSVNVPLKIMDYV